MTPPLTQNLKAVGLWVFFLIYSLTFSFLFNVGLRLTLGYPTISPQVRVPIIWVGHHQVGANHQLLVPLLHSPSYEPVTIRSVRTFGSDTTCWKNPRGHNQGDLTRRRNGPNIHKGMTPPLTQNLTYCLTFSFWFNVGLRITLGYPTDLCLLSLGKLSNHFFQK